MPSDLPPEQREAAVDAMYAAARAEGSLYMLKGIRAALDALLAAGWRPEPQPAGTAPCCMCGKVVDTREIGEGLIDCPQWGVVEAYYEGQATPPFWNVDVHDFCDIDRKGRAQVEAFPTHWQPLTAALASKESR